MLCLTTFLFALSAIETGHNDAAIGKAGERSRYQISEPVWAKWDSLSPHEDCKGDDATQCATSHINHIRRTLLTDDPLIIASAWNQGITGHKRRGPNDHAQRVSNLYHAIMREQERGP